MGFFKDLKNKITGGGGDGAGERSGSTPWSGSARPGTGDGKGER